MLHIYREYNVTIGLDEITLNIYFFRFSSTSLVWKQSESWSYCTRFENDVNAIRVCVPEGMVCYGNPRVSLLLRIVEKRKNATFLFLRPLTVIVHACVRARSLLHVYLCDVVPLKERNDQSIGRFFFFFI